MNPKTEVVLEELDTAELAQEIKQRAQEEKQVTMRS